MFPLFPSLIKNKTAKNSNAGNILKLNPKYVSLTFSLQIDTPDCDHISRCSFPASFIDVWMRAPPPGLTSHLPSTTLTISFADCIMVNLCCLCCGEIPRPRPPPSNQSGAPRDTRTVEQKRPPQQQPTSSGSNGVGLKGAQKVGAKSALEANK